MLNTGSVSINPVTVKTRNGELYLPSGERRAFRWIGNSVELLPGSAVARAASQNGSVVVGQAYWPDTQTQGAVQCTVSGRMVKLGTLGDPISAAYAASSNGKVIIGKWLTTSLSNSKRTFRWTNRKKMQDLRRELLDAGVTAVQNWTLHAVTSVSHDGTVIVGYGRNPNLQFEAWRVVLPLPR